MKQTNVEVRQIIINNYNNGKSLREIGKIVNRSFATVQYIINKYKNENTIQRTPRNAVNKKLNEHDKRWILREIRQNPKLSAPKLTQKVQQYLGKSVNPETVRRVLRENNFHGRIARNKPYINERNRQKRLQFAKEYLNKDYNFWQHVIFTDESKFNLFSSDGKIPVWRKPNEEYKIQNCKSTVKHGGGSAMLWGCMSAAGVGSLEFIDVKMNKWDYLNILKRNLRSSAEKLGILQSFQFYGDNDPKHSSRVAQEWLLYNCPKVIHTPPQSPDLNVIEHLWNILDINIRKHKFSNIRGLKDSLQEEWQKIDPNLTKKLVQSMPKRLQEVIKNKGYPTKY